VIFDVAPDNAGVPGEWTQLYSETWNVNVRLSSIQFEMKAGTFQNEANAPGSVIFDNFQSGASITAGINDQSLSGWPT